MHMSMHTKPVTVLYTTPQQWHSRPTQANGSAINVQSAIMAHEQGIHLIYPEHLTYVNNTEGQEQDWLVHKDPAQCRQH